MDKTSQFSPNSWLKKHLDEFVKPILGNKTPYRLPDNYAYYFTANEMTVIKNMWRAIKRMANGRTILLPGRDTYLFEILARRENANTIFRPDISGDVSRAHKSYGIFKDKFKECFAVDSGYAGSVPMNLGIKDFVLIKATANGNSLPMVKNPNGQSIGINVSSSKCPLLKNNKNHNLQVFPKAIIASPTIASKMESCPRYWETAMYSGYDGEKNKIVQNLHGQPEIILKAALFTIEVYTDSSPKFLPRPFTEPFNNYTQSERQMKEWREKNPKYANNPLYKKCPRPFCYLVGTANSPCPRHGAPSVKIPTDKRNFHVWEGE